MKDIKCPLCGRSLQFFPDLHEIAMGRIGCPNCDWTTLLGFEETVWEEAEKNRLQDVYGDADSYYPTGIKKWPWELEQKGGQQ